MIESTVDTIKVFSPVGTYLRSWGGTGSGPGQLHFASDLAIDAAGIVYVLDGGNSRVQRFTEQGTFLSA